MVVALVVGGDVDVVLCLGDALSMVAVDLQSLFNSNGKLASKRSTSNVFLLIWYLMCSGKNSPGPVCQSVEDTVFCR